MKIKYLLGATLLAAAAAAPAGAWAQAIDQRISTLQTRLAITPAQTTDWTAFAQAMRDNATSTNQLFQQRAQNAASMSAVDNMKSYAAIARSYADNTEKLADAFASLYGKLSAEQQKTADQLFRQPPAPAPTRRK
jgi:catalase (peroxidase I)